MKLYSIDDFRIDNFRLDRYRLDNYRLDGAGGGGIPLSTLNVGDKVKFGSIYNEPIVWLVADKNHTGYPSDSVTLVSERIIKLMAFDAKEPLNSDSNRQSGGNNRYLHSNIRQWLNSDKAAGQWYSAQHAADAPPDSGAVTYNPYTSQVGFLNAFTEAERNALLGTTLIVAKNTVTDGGGSETVTDKMFLLSTTEVGFPNENDIAEGSLLALFSDDTSRICYPTTAAVSNSDYTSEGLDASSAWRWRIRTPYAPSPKYVRHVNIGGTPSYTTAHDGYFGLRPACNLADTTLISATVDEDGCYTIV